MSELLSCGHAPNPSSCGTGYAITGQGDKICYECCGIRDRENMRDMKAGERISLYLVPRRRDGMPVTSRDGWEWITAIKCFELINWPGTLRIPINTVKRGRHNIAGWRYDFWFGYQGADWHGVSYGDNTDLAHCQKLKRGINHDHCL